MAWIRVDDHFDEHPKFAKAGPLGIALWLAGLAYSNRNLTDGFIPSYIAMKLILWHFPDKMDGSSSELVAVMIADPDFDTDDGHMHAPPVPVGTGWVISRLVDSGLWEEVAEGYMIHDYPDYQPSKGSVIAERAAKHQRNVNGGRSRADGPRDGGKFTSLRASQSPARAPAHAHRETSPQTQPQVLGASSSLSPSLSLDISTSLSNSGAPQAETPTLSLRRRKKVTARFDYPPNFEAFWEVFPVKSGKLPAYGRWKELGAETDELLRVKIIAGARAYAAHVAANPDQSVKYAQGWLTDMRWEDDFGPVTLVGSDPYAEATKRGLAEKERRMHEKAV